MNSFDLTIAKFSIRTDNLCMHYVIAGIAFLFIIFLLNFIIGKISYHKAGKIHKQKNIQIEKARAKGLVVNCPLCNSPLMPGEDLITRVYRPMDVPHQLCTINGCPHCYPTPEPGIVRICPSCHKEVDLKNHLIARLFNKEDGKKHVAVTGCNKCCASGK